MLLEHSIEDVLGHSLCGFLGIQPFDAAIEAILAHDVAASGNRFDKQLNRFQNQLLRNYPLQLPLERREKSPPLGLPLRGGEGVPLLPS